MSGALTFLALILGARAATLAGVTLPDTATVGGQPLVLNGLGLREKYTLDIYVGGLYLPVRSKDAAAIIALDAPKRVVMQFVYDEIPKEKLAETLYEGLAKYPEFAHLKPSVDIAAATAEDVVAGDQMVYEYIPGKGTIITVKGKQKAVIPGRDFMTLVFNLYVGPRPASEGLKQGMLGLE